MTRRRIVVVLVAALALLLAWRGTRSDTSAPADPFTPAARGVDPAFADSLARGRQAMGRSGAIGLSLPRADGSVAISGTVVDAESHAGVGGVEVVFLSPLGESSATSAKDGTYRIEVEPGVYRAYVRDDSVMSVGVPDHQRLPGLPSADAANAPDEALIPIVVAKADTAGLDLSVLRGGVLDGRVLDSKGKPVAGVVLRARGNTWRPALGSDIVETDADGTFSMRMPTGHYALDASHPQFAGLALDGMHTVRILAGSHEHVDLTLASGCVITGRVVGADGRATGDGAIERKWGENDQQFGPAGTITADGTFRWVTTETADITIRAWPWKSPPSPARTFSCKDGARFADVVFALPSARPDLEGVLVDRTGAPVAFAFIDVAPLDVGYSQQERTDAQGKWAIYNMPAGRYQITAYAPDRGVVAATLAAPIHDARLQLGGTGRVEGTTTQLAEGSFQVELSGCDVAGGSVSLPHEPRLVTVAGGRFSIDSLPACNLSFTADWHGQTLEQQLDIVADNTANVELDVGPPHAKTVHGVVRDDTGAPIVGARVNAFLATEDVASAQTDATGRYTLESFSGAQVTAGDGGRFGKALVGRANVSDEEVDVTISKTEYQIEESGEDD